MRLPSMSTPASMNSAFARLGFFWFGIQAIWGALLGISLQARSAEIAGPHALVLYGLVATGGAFVAGCVQLIVGPWSDRRRAGGKGRTEFYVIGALLGAGALVWFYKADSTMTLLLAYVALQAGLNVAIGPYQAAIPDAAGAKSAGLASAWMAGLQSAGNATGALLATGIGSPILLAGTLGALLLASCAVTVTVLRGWRLERQVAAPVRLSRAFACLFISRVFVFAGFYTLLGYLFFYVLAFVTPDDPSRAREVDGIFVLMFTIAAAAGAIVAAKPSDRFDRRNVAGSGGLAVVVALLVFVAGRSLLAAGPAVVLAGLGWGVFLVADWALACSVIPANMAAGAMAVWNLAVIAPQIIAPLVTTAVLEPLGRATGSGAALAFGLAAAEVLVGIWVLRRLPVASVRE